jgi:putative oxidoreductase
MFGTEGKSPVRYLYCADNVAMSAQDFLLLVARVMAGLIFLNGGWSKMTNLSGFVTGQMNNGVPAVLAYIAPFAEFLGGLALVIGFASRYAALGLLLFTLIATYLAHRYWTYPAAEQRAQSGQFWKNVSIMGGLLALFVAGPGRFAVDRFLRR